MLEYTEKVVLSQYSSDGLEPRLLRSPKESLANYVIRLTTKKPEYILQPMRQGSSQWWRATVHTEDGPDDFVGIGEHPAKRDAERIAALSALLQAANHGKLHQVLAPNWSPPPIQPTLSDGSVLDIDRAHIFMEYYCLNYQLPNPSLDLAERRGVWEAKLSIDGDLVATGTAANKKLATTNAYLESVAWLDQSDPDLWNKFLKDTKGRGDAVGMAPPYFVSIGPRLSSNIRDLTTELKESELYRNSPSGAESTESDIVPTPGPSTYRPKDDEFHQRKSASLLEALNTYTQDPTHSAIRDQRFSLPIHTRSKDLLELIESQDVTICMAATGSGKTTQIPQIILDDWIQKGQGSKCNIICTQPRRIAAISVADRVAKERGQVVGPRSEIGYQVRFDAKLPSMHGSVTFCTTGIFLKRMQTALLGGSQVHDDRSLDDVTHIVIDEVHERDVDTDLSLAVIKRLLADRKARNKPLKVILMSATIDPTLFQSYFQDTHGQKAKVIDIPGRSFPVDKHFLEDYLVDLANERIATTNASWVLNDRSVVEYLNKEVGPSALAQLRQPNTYPTPVVSRAEGSGEDLDVPYPLVALTVAHTLKKSDNGHVLVFLPGWEEIQSVNRILSDPNKYPLLGMDFSDRSKYSIHLLHSTIPVAEQQQVFEPAPEGVRRIILSTNIAETSITIPDVVYVVDSGKVKEKRYDPERHMSSLVSAWVGSSNLNQRAGRAGRHRPGEYYGLVSRSRLEQLNPYQLVEMKRADLSNVVMHVKALDFPNMDVEEIFSSLIEPPAAARVHAALETLRVAGALTENEELTPLGRVLLQIPIDVGLARMAIYGALFKALDPALTLAAILSNREPFNSPPALKMQATAAKLAFAPPVEARSDPLAALNAFNAWWEMQSAGRYAAANDFCNKNFLNKPVLLTVAKVKYALLQALQTSGILGIANGGRRVEIKNGDPRGGSKETQFVVPRELNGNADSLSMLGALIAIGSQPNFAMRTSEKSFRTFQDKMTFVHPTSTNGTFTFGKQSPGQSQQRGEVWDRYVLAFVEKSRNVQAGQPASSATTFLRNVTRLDGLQYMLFGADKVEETPEGVACDKWLPIQGGAHGSLANVAELKVALDRCMQRVFEGIHAANVERRQAKLRRVGSFSTPDEDRDADAVAENELEEEDDEDTPSRKHRRASTLSNSELSEIGYLTRDLVQTLDSFAEDHRSFKMRGRSSTTGSMSGYSSSRGSPSGGSGRGSLQYGDGMSAFARGLRASSVSVVGSYSPRSSRPGTPYGDRREYSTSGNNTSAAGPITSSPSFSAGLGLSGLGSIPTTSATASRS
ncbi:P-loop containing nucleoside triphosphate hydrolase protein [Clavulina sp. PMI_390]|nr:P-loop containing nucleoside triphosphate hydrolase protein [Clavulina sp. PMI_390]